MPLKVFVVVVTYNAGHEWLDKCLGSVRLCKEPLHCIVIDNASSDDSVVYIHENFPEVEIIASQENLGFAKANNLGISNALAAGAEHIFLLNHDAWLTNNCLETLLQLQRQFPEYGILSPVHLNGSGELLDWNFCQYISKGRDDGRKLYSHLLKQEALEPIYQMEFINAAAWLLSRKCLEQVGLFDCDLFVHYGEDSNYAQRARFHKFKIGVSPHCFVHHDRESRAGKLSSIGFNQNADFLAFVLDTSNPLQENFSKLVNYHLRNCMKQMAVYILKFKFQEFVQQVVLYRKMKKMIPVIAARLAVNKRLIK